MVYYLSPIIHCGIDAVASLGDGYTINVKWFQAYPTITTNSVAYHIYYSTVKEHIFTEGVKYASIDDSLEANIIDLNPGQEYFFAVRPLEYNPSFYNLSVNLPVAYDNLRYYPQSILRQNISAVDTIIPLLDVEGFPGHGIIRIGVELIEYSAVDVANSDLLLSNVSQRGYRNTFPLPHMVDGYDGYRTWNPIVVLFTEGEDTGYDYIYACQSRFEYPNYQFTAADGYHQVTKDLLTLDLSASDEANIDFPMYDYAGYHRTDPVQLFDGTCIGSYIGGEQGCIDAYGNVNMVRGLSVQDQNNQRQEVLLSTTGRPAVLIRRQRTGITCACYLPSSEYPDDRCPKCHGGKFVLSYEQYFNPRRSDGRIMVRVGTADEDVKMYEGGLESEFQPEIWTLTVPTIKDRDILVLFDQDDNEEFRYEVLSVTRNNTLLGQMGGQKMKVQRIRKYDPAYQIRVFRNTSMFPSKMNTTIGFAVGIPPHTHEIVISEKILSSSQINQTTAIIQGHNHQITAGVVQQVLGHTHAILL